MRKPKPDCPTPWNVGQYSNQVPAQSKGAPVPAINAIVSFLSQEPVWLKFQWTKDFFMVPLQSETAGGKPQLQNSETMSVYEPRIHLLVCIQGTGQLNLTVCTCMAEHFQNYVLTSVFPSVKRPRTHFCFRRKCYPLNKFLALYLEQSYKVALTMLKWNFSTPYFLHGIFDTPNTLYGLFLAMPEYTVRVDCPPPPPPLAV